MDRAQPGLLMPPGPPGWWDEERLSSPGVLRLPDGSWAMWYYGRDPSFDREINLPTGRIGLARSPDGVSWERVRGPGIRGSVLDPSPDPAAFDSSHVGIGCVLQEDGLFWMWYFGGDHSRSLVAGQPRKGLSMACGLAVSRDGEHWFRLRGPERGAFLEPGGQGQFDLQFAAWPKVLRHPAGGYLMTYHTLDPVAFTFHVGVATSPDGFAWTRHGEILGPGGPGSFDERGIATRQVLWLGDRFVMVYEGNSADRYIGLGLAWSRDGLHWEKDPAGMVFGPTRGTGRWDSRAVGCPCLVPMEDGSWRMYYMGAAEGGVDELTSRHQLGLAVSDGSLYHWRRWGE